MQIEQLTIDQLPLWLIETRNDQGVWQRFTHEPFTSKEEAQWHQQLVIRECALGQPERVIVSEYTVDHWRTDLISKILKDEACTERALSLLPCEDLVLALKQA